MPFHHSIWSNTLLPRALDTIDAVYLQTLPQHGPSESKRIEYKSQFRDDGDKGAGIDRDTFRKDVSQFANTEGGDLIIGVREKDGLPTHVAGVNLGADSPHAIKERLDQLLLEIQPRLTGHHIVYHEVERGRFVFVIRVPQSFRGPHCIGSGKGFFYRTNSGRDAMNVDQLREAFLSGSEIATQLAAFREKRVEFIGNNTGDLVEGVLSVLHILPAVGVSRKLVIDMVRQKKALLGDDPAGYRHTYAGVNFDGAYIAHGISGHPLYGYAQWFRNGFREIAWVYPVPSYQRFNALPGSELVFDEAMFARNIVLAAGQTIQVLRQLDVPYPFYLAVSVLRCAGFRLGYYEPQAQAVVQHPNSVTVVSDKLELLEVLVESEDDDLPIILRPAFDQFANAFGLPQSWNYDLEGRWKYR